MLIRPASPEDIPRILILERQAQQAAHWPEGKYREIFNCPVPTRFVLVIEHESSVQGFGILRVIDQESEIENVVVADGSRRQGWGIQLLRRSIELARNMGAITLFLEVRDSNLPARALYNRSGLIESGRRKRYYTAPEEDAVLYRLALLDSSSSDDS